jgi:hypothetical protein
MFTLIKRHHLARQGKYAEIQSTFSSVGLCNIIFYEYGPTSSLFNQPFPRRHDIQHNNIQHDDIQHNDIQQNDIQHNDIQHNNIQYNDIQLNDTHNET